MAAFIWFPYVTVALLLVHAFVDWIGVTAFGGNPMTSRRSGSTMAVQAEMPTAASPWYSHPDIGRDRNHVLTEDYPRPCYEETSRFLLMTKKGLWHTKTTAANDSTETAPLYLSVSEVDKILTKCVGIKGLYDLHSRSQNEIDDKSLLIWCGSHEGLDYWIVYVPDVPEDIAESFEAVLNELVKHDEKSDRKVLAPELISCAPLREFGDRLSSSVDAGLVSTANGLVEFHKSHRFCSHCGSPTVPAKAGASRHCTKQNDPNCPARSVYPRIDVATIMLITSPCEQYALLGRKKSWPAGRYSTLAGFAEVGETLNECCIRETYEESGVMVDPSSLRIVASQPWPFPKSLMVGLHGRALQRQSASPDDGDDDGDFDESLLPPIVIDLNEMEDIRWFAKDFIKEKLNLPGSTASTYKPTGEEADFHFPGKSSLARVLISEWVNGVTK